MAKMVLKEWALRDAVKEMPNDFYTTDLAAHEIVLEAHFRTEPDRELNTRVGDWLSHEGYRFSVLKHPEHPAGVSNQRWQRRPMPA